MNTQSLAPERERVRAELDRRRMLRAAAAVVDHQVVERRLEREADAEMRRDGRVTAANAAERRRMREMSIAKRRDALHELSYPMTDDELKSACQHATLSARVSPDQFEDVSQELALTLVRRYGATIQRVKVGAWLRSWAADIAQRQNAQRERATGMRAAAEQLADWHEQDHRAAMADAAAAGDPVWALAAGMPARDLEPSDPNGIARRLGLSPAQTDALRVACDMAGRVAPMTGAQRVAWHAACKVLRERFPTVDALKLASRPAAYAASVLVDAAIGAERERAALASRGC